MDKNLFSKMKADFFRFYKNDIEAILPDIQKARIKYSLYPISMYLFLCGIAFFTLLCFLPRNLTDSFHAYLIPYMFFSVIFLYLSDRIFGSQIKNFDAELKDKFLNKFLNIFFDSVVYKHLNYPTFVTSSSSSYIKDYVNKLKNIKIFNSIPFLYQGDFITAEYNGIKLKIEEISTSVTFKISYALEVFCLMMMKVLAVLIFFPFFIFLMLIVPNFFTSFLTKAVEIIHDLLLYAPFRGILIELDFNRAFSGETFFVEKSISANRLSFDKAKYKEVKLESVTFAKKYSIYSTSQIESRKLFSPSVIEKFDNISFSFKPKYIRAYFSNQKLTLAINTNKDMFAMVQEFRKTDFNTFSDLYKEIISILELIDELKVYLKD